MKKLKQPPTKIEALHYLSGYIDRYFFFGLLSGFIVGGLTAISILLFTGGL